MSVTPRKLTDKEIDEAVIALKNGIVEAFQILYRHYGQSVYRFCLRMIGDKSAAQDALQETFIRVFEHSADLRGKNFAAWTFSIARRVCLNSIRDNKRHDSFDEDSFIAPKENERDIAMQHYIGKALLSLPVQLREALILREYEGYSYQEIADIIGVDISLVKVRVHRARCALRKILAPIACEWYEI
ncbi:sigma-70 family RNA polymerase sigma factor [Ignavibacteria bacterium]|nr:RNA polymerase sigma factor [Bacteroidota bacterium]MCZ2133206.1 RNA polymerase sigma factor [Bacteroidota bacterium]